LAPLLQHSALEFAQLQPNQSASNAEGSAVDGAVMIEPGLSQERTK